MKKAGYNIRLQVQLMGLEPTPTYVDMNLNHARMPIPPQLLMK